MKMCQTASVRIYENGSQLLIFSSKSQVKLVKDRKNEKI